MPITIETRDGAVTRVVLSGRLDIAGAHEIDMPLSLVAGSSRAVVVDMREVEFLASLGLRGIVIAAKSILGKHGRIVLLAPQPQVMEVLTVSGIEAMIPIHDDEERAFAAVRD